MNDLLVFDGLDVPSFVAKFLAISMVILFYSSGMHLLLMVGCLALFSNYMVFTIRLFHYPPTATYRP
jgi:hypothetical protein